MFHYHKRRLDWLLYGSPPRKSLRRESAAGGCNKREPKRGVARLNQIAAVQVDRG
jgi:hypothetical protein